MIDIKTIGSGSSGNCYLVNINNTKILLEAGLPFKNIQKALNFSLSDIESCLITHEHTDHAKAAKNLIKNGIDCYMTKGTAESLSLKGHRLKTFNKDENNQYKSTEINQLIIKPFEAVHDVAEPVSFYIKDKETKESLLFVTDSAYMKYKIPDVDILMVEANYIKELIDKRVESGTINIHLRNRIVKSHMSLETLLDALNQVKFTKLKKVYVLHLSDSNSDMYKIKEAVQKKVGVEVEIC